MFLVNPMKAKLIKYNRNESDSVFDDEDTKTKNIRVCPYNTDDAIKFGINSVPEATGYFVVQKYVDAKEGDQIVFRDKTYTILKVQENWIFNRIENIHLAVK